MERQYYERNLELLNRAFQTFMAENPPASDTQKIDDADPDVQDLLKGFAYLMGELHTKIELHGDDLYHLYAQHVLGSLMWAKPSILPLKLRFIGPPEGSENRLKTGTPIQTDDDVAPRFSMPYSYDLQPFEVGKTEAVQGQSQTPSLSLNLQILPPAAHTCPDFIRLHLMGHYTDSANLYALLLHNVEKIELFNPDTPENSVALDPRGVMPCDLDGDKPLYGQTTFDIEAIGLMLEHVLMPHKTLCLGVNLSRSPAAVAFLKQRTDQALTLKFTFKRESSRPFPDYDPKILEDIVVNAVFASNLFAQQSVPIRYRGERALMPVLPARTGSSNTYPHSVVSVYGIANDKRRQFHDYNDYVMNSSRLPALTYGVKVAHSTRSAATLMLEVAFGPQEPVYEEESFICTLLCTQGYQAAKLSPGKSSSIDTDQFSLMAINPRSPSTFVPMLNHEKAKQALSYEFAISSTSLSELSELKAFLSYIQLLSGTEPTDAFAKKIEALEKISIADSQVLKGTQVVSGQTIQLFVDLEGFESIGDAAVFGELISVLYSAYAPPNCFTHVQICDKEGGQVLFDLRRSIGSGWIIGGDIITH